MAAAEEAAARAETEAAQAEEQAQADAETALREAEAQAQAEEEEARAAAEAQELAEALEQEEFEKAAALAKADDDMAVDGNDQPPCPAYVQEQELAEEEDAVDEEELEGEQPEEELADATRGDEDEEDLVAKLDRIQAPLLAEADSKERVDKQPFAKKRYDIKPEEEKWLKKPPATPPPAEMLNPVSHDSASRADGKGDQQWGKGSIDRMVGDWWPGKGNRQDFPGKGGKYFEKGDKGGDYWQDYSHDHGGTWPAHAWGSSGVSSSDWGGGGWKGCWEGGKGYSGPYEQWTKKIVGKGADWIAASYSRPLKTDVQDAKK